jgi:hypothetical protein
LIQIGKYCGMEMNVEETKIMRISRQPSPILIMVDQTQLENVECFDCVGSVITNDAVCMCKIKSKLSWQKRHSTRRFFTNKLDVFHSQIGLKFKEGTSKVLHLERGFVWCRNWDTSESGSEIPGKF